MSNVTSINSASSEQLLDEASLWIAKIDRELSETETIEFQKWMNSNQSHKDMLIQMAQMWDKMEALERLGGLFPHVPKTSISLKPYIAMAASFILACILSVSVWQSGVFQNAPLVAQQVLSENTYTTSIGEQSIFFLQDKTQIKLNTNSLVKVTYTDKQRVLELLRGEMHVVVAHNKRKPLSVYAGSNIIQAVGTAFNVELSNDEIELIVTDGKVLVSDINSLSVAPIELKNVYLSPKSFAVSKGQKAQLRASNTSIISSNEVKLASDLAWQQGNLIFRGESLFEAMQEVARYTNYQFDFGDDDIKKLQIAGLFKTSDISGLLAALETNFDVTYEKMSRDKIRLSKKRLSD